MHAQMPHTTPNQRRGVSVSKRDSSFETEISGLGLRDFALRVVYRDSQFFYFYDLQFESLKTLGLHSFKKGNSLGRIQGEGGVGDGERGR